MSLWQKQNKKSDASWIYRLNARREDEQMYFKVIVTATTFILASIVLVGENVLKFRSGICTHTSEAIKQPRPPPPPNRRSGRKLRQRGGVHRSPRTNPLRGIRRDKSNVRKTSNRTGHSAAMRGLLDAPDMQTMKVHCRGSDPKSQWLHSFAVDMRRVCLSTREAVDSIVTNLAGERSHIIWRRVDVPLEGGNTYYALLGVPVALNMHAKCDVVKMTVLALRASGLKRCVLVDVRTQTSMLSCTPVGVAVVSKINYAARRLIEEAKKKDWETLVQTYEMPTIMKSAMLNLLGENLSSNKSDTWKSISRAIRQADPSWVQSDMHIAKAGSRAVSIDAATSYREALCRQAVQSIYGREVKVSRVRPAWLLSPHSNRSLELDVFCPAMNLAVEYNGMQHYKFKDHRELNQRVEKDLSKMKQSSRMGIHLLVVPYIVPVSDIERHIALYLASRDRIAV